MNREQKAAVIDEVAGEIGGSEAIFALDYRGITVAQVAELRSKLRDSDTKLRVVKNSLSERAADQAGIADLKSLLVGPTALALVKGDAASAAKVLSDTARELRGPLEFKGGFMNGAMLTPADVQSIARLPSREVLNGQLVGTIAAPLSGLVRTLNALISGLAVQLGQIADQGLVSGQAQAIDASSEAGTAKASAEASTPAPAEPAPAEPASAAEATEAEPAAEPAEVLEADTEIASAEADAGSAAADVAAGPEAGEEPMSAEAEASPEPEAATATEGASDDGPSDE